MYTRILNFYILNLIFSSYRRAEKGGRRQEECVDEGCVDGCIDERGMEPEASVLSSALSVPDGDLQRKQAILVESVEKILQMENVI